MEAFSGVELVMPPEWSGFHWTGLDKGGHGRHKNPVGTGFSALLWIRLDPDLVEAAGV